MGQGLVPLPGTLIPSPTCVLLVTQDGGSHEVQETPPIFLKTLLSKFWQNPGSFFRRLLRCETALQWSVSNSAKPERD